MLVKPNYMLEHLESLSDPSVKLDRIRQSAGKAEALAYLIGVYLGDGWMGYLPKHHSWQFRLNTIDKDFAEATAYALYQLVGRKPKICTHSVTKSTRLNHSITFGCKELFFIRCLTRKKVQIPVYIWNATTEEKLAFIAGIMDSEGYVQMRLNSKSNGILIGINATGNWMYGFKMLLESIGIQIGKIYKEILPSGKGYIKFLLKAKSWIASRAYFNIARKQNRILAWALHPQRLHVGPQTKAEADEWVMIQSELRRNTQNKAEMTLSCC